MPSSPVSAPPLPRRQAWIVSAWWDLSYLVITPVLIVPVVLIVARHWSTPEAISLAVIAFASLGHHLPGFMRAYGDRELFARFRTRFLLVPPLAFMLALLFSPPQWLQTALQLRWNHLHGLELILLLWGTWHGMMQTYGFMRIYDVRLGTGDRWSSRLDYWLCGAVFVAGVVFSDARVFALVSTMWQSGLPLFGPEWIVRARWLVATVGFCVLGAYAIHFFSRCRQGKPVSWLKLLLIGITGWFYWYTGRLSTNVLIGLAMFEIYHAVQYYAIVWIYNRRLFERGSQKFGLLGFLFRDRWLMLGIYLAAIAAYSSIRFFTVDANEYVFRGGSHDSYQWLVALFVTSSILHFYFDGFIWQVSEKKTQRNLVDECSATATSDRRVPAMVHALKLAMFFSLALTLVFSEQFFLFDSPVPEADRVVALAELTPELPECQSMLCQHALQQGDAEAALKYGERARVMRPRSHTARADLALALILANRWDDARDCLQEAISMAPHQWTYHVDLATVLERLGETDQAERFIREAIRLQPDLASPRQQLGEFFFRQDRTAEAEAEFGILAERFPNSLAAEMHQARVLVGRGEFQQAVELAYFLAIGNPENRRVLLLLGSVLNAIGDREAAFGPLEQSRQMGRPVAEIDYQLGIAWVQSEQPGKAVGHLLAALRTDADHFEARLLLANTFYLLAKYDRAVATYEHCLKLRPEEARVYANLGGVYAQLGKLQQAEAIYRQGIAVDADSGHLSYNLGLLLLQAGHGDEARKLILRAQELGIEISAEVRAVLERPGT
ncbi:MAG: tetratricopeptide repeat protein [Pirellulales bacterium]|nr:tetratricopeptide repeat protein [Pirellulales bacterium]